MNLGLLGDQVDAHRVGQLADALSDALGAQMACMVVQSRDGSLWLCPHPHYGVEVLTILRDMDWNAAIRVAEEFTP